MIQAVPSDADGWRRVRAFARAETIGADTLRRYVDAVVGPEPCCPRCARKDTPEKRGVTRSAWAILSRHLRSGGDRFDPARVAAAIRWLDAFTA